METVGVNVTLSSLKAKLDEVMASLPVLVETSFNARTSVIASDNCKKHPVLDALVTAFENESISSTNPSVLTNDRLKRLEAELKSMVAATETDMESIKSDLASLTQWISNLLKIKDDEVEGCFPLLEKIRSERKNESLTANAGSPIISKSPVIPKISDNLALSSASSLPITTVSTLLPPQPQSSSSLTSSSTNTKISPLAKSASPKIRNLNTLVTEYSNEMGENLKKRKSPDGLEETKDVIVSPVANSGPTLKIKLVAPPKPKPTSTTNISSSSFNEGSTDYQQKPKKIKKEGKTNMSQSPMEESSAKPKVQNQVPITVFWNYVEGFFRPFNDADINFLASHNDRKDLFKALPLGKHYKEIWTEEDRKAGLANTGIQIETPIIKKSKFPLTERVRSLIIKIPNPKVSNANSVKEDRSSSPMILDDGESSVGETSNSATTKNDSAIDPSELEDRLSQELKTSGIIEESDKPAVSNLNSIVGEDDEISREIRSLQRQLFEQQVVNRYRKSKLLKSVYRRMISQEFQSVLDDLDKQIETAFGKKKAGKVAKKPKSRSKLITGAVVGGTLISNGNNSGAVAGSGVNHGGGVVEQPQQQTVTQLITKRKNLVRRFRDILPSSSELAVPGPNFRLYHDEEIKREINEATKAALVTASHMDKSYLGNPWLGVPAMPLAKPISHPRPPAFQLTG